MNPTLSDNWNVGTLYEQFMGRWSRLLAAEFVAWLALPARLRWVDVGCGTGALSTAILNRAEPLTVTGVEPSEGFLSEARRQITDSRERFTQGDALALPLDDACCDVSVSGLVLNFVPDPAAMLREMARVTESGGTMALYLWDYVEGMELLRHFWDAAIAENPAALPLDEGARFPICRPEPLQALAEAVGFTDITVGALEIPTQFRNFEEYWNSFLGAQGPAPAYVASLDAEARERLRAALQNRLTPTADGAIALRARAWVMRGRVP